MPRADRPPASPGRLPGRPPERRDPGPGQDALDGLADPEPYRPGPGATRLAVEASIGAAKAAGRLGLIEGALCAIAVEQARAVDLAVQRMDPWQISQANKALLAILDRLNLVPSVTPADTGGPDPLGAFLAGLTGPQVGNTANA